MADFGIGGLSARQSLHEPANHRSIRSQILPTAVRGAYTPLYASPQQVQGEPPDPRDDVHALGVIWYQLVTGDLKLVAIPPDWRDVVEEKGLGEDYIRIMASCLSSRAERRMATAIELAGRLAALREQETDRRKQEEGRRRKEAEEAARQQQEKEERALRDQQEAERKRNEEEAAQQERRRQEKETERRRQAEAAAGAIAEAIGQIGSTLPGALAEMHDSQNDLTATAAAATSRFESARDDFAAGRDTIRDVLSGQVEFAARIAADVNKIGAEITALTALPVFTNSIVMEFVLIPAGTFVMGSPDNEAKRESHEGPQHEVEITGPFYLGVCQVTQEQYERVMGVNPSHFKSVAGEYTPFFPVENVSWEEAAEFCNKLSAMPEEKKNGRVYRLPTEAEWEYSCRGGRDSRIFHFSNTLGSYQANFDGNYPYGRAGKGPFLKRTCKVGSYSANDFGLYDMHGNVWEWCADWYGKDYYGKSPRCNPPGPAEGSDRVRRGGSWLNRGLHCRSACRFRSAPADRDRHLGFRAVLVFRQPSIDELSKIAVPCLVAKPVAPPAPDFPTGAGGAASRREAGRTANPDSRAGTQDRNT